MSKNGDIAILYTICYTLATSDAPQLRYFRHLGHPEISFLSHSAPPPIPDPLQGDFFPDLCWHWLAHGLQNDAQTSKFKLQRTGCPHSFRVELAWCLTSLTLLHLPRKSDAMRSVLQAVAHVLLNFASYAPHVQRRPRSAIILSRLLL